MNNKHVEQFEKIEVEREKTGVNAKKLCAKHGVVLSSYYGWKSKQNKLVPTSFVQPKNPTKTENPLHRVIAAQNRLISELTGMLQ